MAETNDKNSKLIQCPLCDTVSFPVFRFLNGDDYRSSYLVECENNHRAFYTITHAGNVILASFELFREEETPKFSYSVYLESPEWKSKSRAAKVKAGWHCMVCNKAGDNGSLHTHHRTYENIGDEKPGDLIVLCADCHAKFHDKVGANG